MTKFVPKGKVIWLMSLGVYEFMRGVMGRGTRQSRKSRGSRGLEEGMRGIARYGSTVSKSVATNHYKGSKELL